MKATIYLGGGQGSIQFDLGSTIPALADVSSSITTRSNVDTAIATSNPVAVAAGQTVLVSAVAVITNGSGGPGQTGAVIGIVSGPTVAPAGPVGGTPTVSAGDGFPLASIAAFKGLPAGTYVFGLFIHQGIGHIWTVGDWEIITELVG